MRKLLSLINIVNEDSYINIIRNSILSKKRSVFFYINSHTIFTFYNNKIFMKSFLDANYYIADGISSVFAYKSFFKKDISKTVFTYSYNEKLRDLFLELNASIFFLGSKEETIQKVFNIENKFYKNGKLHYHNGYFNLANETEKIIKMINNAKVDVLIVGMGIPISENWISQNKIKINVKCIFSVGGFFDFVSKDKILAPRWMFNTGLEWIFRFLQEPKRLFKRYLFSNIFFIYKFIKTKFIND